MSLVFRGTRSDIEDGLSGPFSDRRVVRVRTRPMPLLISVLLLFLTILNSELYQYVLFWVMLGILLIVTTLRIYSTYQHLQAQAHAAAAGDLLAHTEYLLHTTRGRIQGLRLQLALLHRGFDDLDERLRSLDSDITSRNPSMSEEEINALPVHKYKMSNLKSDSDGPAEQQGSTSSALQQLSGIWINMFNDNTNLDIQLETEVDTNSKTSEDELTCIICLEQVATGELVRSLPCLHQFHVGCIDQWLHRQGICPVCKQMVGTGLQESRDGEREGDEMV